jgi:hypothetical protein
MWHFLAHCFYYKNREFVTEYFFFKIVFQKMEFLFLCNQHQHSQNKIVQQYEEKQEGTYAKTRRVQHNKEFKGDGEEKKKRNSTLVSGFST